jgi:hypothetical protein
MKVPRQWRQGILEVPVMALSASSEHSQGSTTPVDLRAHDVSSSCCRWSESSCTSLQVLVQRMMTKNEDPPAMDSLAWSKRSSVAADYELATFKSSDKMSLSDLLI